MYIIDSRSTRAPLFTIGKINFKGDLIGPRTKYFKTHDACTPGETFNRARRSARTSEKLSDLYKDQGYAYANVLPLTTVDVDKRTVDLTFEVAKGKRASTSSASTSAATPRRATRSSAAR